jgi:hypothetical protein
MPFVRGWQQHGTVSVSQPAGLRVQCYAVLCSLISASLGLLHSMWLAATSKQPYWCYCLSNAPSDIQAAQVLHAAGWQPALSTCSEPCSYPQPLTTPQAPHKYLMAGRTTLPHHTTSHHSLQHFCCLCAIRFPHYCMLQGGNRPSAHGVSLALTNKQPQQTAPTTPQNPYL